MTVEDAADWTIDYKKDRRPVMVSYQQRLQIRELYDAGIRDGEIGRQTGLPEYVVSCVRQRLGIRGYGACGARPTVNHDPRQKVSDETLAKAYGGRRYG